MSKIVVIRTLIYEYPDAGRAYQDMDFWTVQGSYVVGPRGPRISSQHTEIIRVGSDQTNKENEK